MKIFLENLSRRDLHDLLMSAILPRPIAFISTIGEDGIFNLAPFSCFAPISIKPSIVCVQISWKRDGRKKDTLKNIEFSQDFVINVVDESIAEAMNQASANYPSNIDEFQEVKLTAIKSDLVKSPRVAESPVNMECKLLKIIDFGEIPTGSNLVIGKIILIHVRDELWSESQIDIYKWRPIGRLGGDLYCRLTDIFEMKRPEDL